MLLFLGLFMAVPLYFHWSELAELEGALVDLEGRERAELPTPVATAPVVAPEDPGTPASAPPEPPEVADLRIGEEALDRLREVVGRAQRFARSGEMDEFERAQKALGRFTTLWDALKLDKLARFRSVEGLDAVTGLAPGDHEGWERAFELVRSHGGTSWVEEPFNLHMSLRHLQDLRVSGNAVSVPPALAHLKREAVRFKRKLDALAARVHTRRIEAAVSEESAEEGPAPDAPPPGPTLEERARLQREAEIRDTQRAFLEMTAEQKRRDLTRVAYLLAVGVFMALFFARILWNDVLDPLGRLQDSFNGAAMSGRPSKVETHGPPEVAQLLQAYNRLIDTVSGEGEVKLEKLPCPNCRQKFEKGDSYCRWCGIPVGTPSRIIPPS